jgi:hypothetical protein
MASGHPSRINRPNTWLLRPDCAVKKVLANTEPSTHGTHSPVAALPRFRLLREGLLPWRWGSWDANS